MTNKFTSDERKATVKNPSKCKTCKNCTMVISPGYKINRTHTTYETHCMVAVEKNGSGHNLPGFKSAMAGYVIATGRCQYERK